MMKQDRWSRRSGRGIFEMRSVRLSEHVLQRQYHLSGGRGINLSQMPTEPRTVQRPHLIQRNFALMPLKGAIHAKWKSFLCTGQWSDNHCADGTVHFLRRDHEAWPRLSLIHISEPTRQAEISYAVFCLKNKNNSNTT